MTASYVENSVLTFLHLQFVTFIPFTWNKDFPIILAFLLFLLIVIYANKFVSVLVWVHWAKNVFVSVCLGFLFGLYIGDFCLKRWLTQKYIQAEIKIQLQKSTSFIRVQDKGMSYKCWKHSDNNQATSSKHS